MNGPFANPPIRDSVLNIPSNMKFRAKLRDVRDLSVILSVDPLLYLSAAVLPFICMVALYPHASARNLCPEWTPPPCAP